MFQRSPALAAIPLLTCFFWHDRLSIYLSIYVPLCMPVALSILVFVYFTFLSISLCCSVYLITSAFCCMYLLCSRCFSIHLCMYMSVSLFSRVLFATHSSLSLSLLSSERPAFSFASHLHYFLPHIACNFLSSLAPYNLHRRAVIQSEAQFPLQSHLSWLHCLYLEAPGGGKLGQRYGILSPVPRLNSPSPKITSNSREEEISRGGKEHA